MRTTLFRLGSLMSATVSGQRANSSTAALSVHNDTGGDRWVKLSPTAGQLYSENVRFPLWPA